MQLGIMAVLWHHWHHHASVPSHLTLSALMAVAASANVLGDFPSTWASQPRLTMAQSAYMGVGFGVSPVT